MCAVDAISVPLICRPKTGGKQESSLSVAVQPSDAHRRFVLALEHAMPAAARDPCHIICLIDVSGSMDDLASLGAGSTEQSLFSALDLAKHSLTVLSHMLGPQDSLCIITFNESAEAVFETRSVDKAAVGSIKNAIDAMRAGGGTNIWAALDLGLRKAAAQTAAGGAGDHVSMLLLTDGCPNSAPPEGTAAAFANAYAALRPAHSISLHTFGYGYNLDSELLGNLATTSAGLYAFIPDATMVGTVFVNCVSGLMATAQHHVLVHVTGSSALAPRGFPQQSTVTAALSPKATARSLTGHDVAAPTVTVTDIGAIQFGHTRVICLEVPPHWQGHVLVQGVDGQTFSPSGDDVVGDEAANPYPADAATASPAVHDDCIAREVVLEALAKACDTKTSLAAKQKAIAEAQATLGCMQARRASGTVADFVVDLCGEGDDVGQLRRAVEQPEWHSKWGKHYLPSVYRAHRLQLCMNFKDASVQQYGGPLFRALQAVAEQLFCSLPPPTATGSAPGSQSAAPASMTAYYNYSGG